MPITVQRDDVMLPAFVQIEPVGQCNLRCEMCSIRLRRAGPPFGPPAFMRLSAFKKIIDELEGVEKIHLQGLGEPLLHPSIFEMVSYAVRRGIGVTTNSNMTVLDPERAEECVRSGLSWIRISIDGATPKTYEGIRKGSRLRLVLQNIELLQATKERLNSPIPGLFLVMVAMRRNIHELNDIIRLARRFSIRQVFVQHLCHDFTEEPLSSRYRLMREFVEAETLLNQDPRRIEQLFREARLLADELSIELRLPRLAVRSYPPGTAGRFRCSWPWESAYISYDGRAMPCCMVSTPDRVNFGNVAARGVRPVWNSEAYRAFRARLDSDDPPPICRSCSLYQGIF